MKEDRQVTGVKRAPGKDGKPGAIVALCGFGDFRCWTRGQVLNLIDSGDTFYVMANGKRADIRPVPKLGGADRYLRTDADDIKEDNLDSLTDSCVCPPFIGLGT